MDDVEGGGDTFPFEDNDIVRTAFSGDTEEQSASAHSPTPCFSNNKSRGAPRTSMSSPSAFPLCLLRAGIPPGVNPQVISSSNTSEMRVTARPRSTGVGRKNMSGHSLIAEAT